MKVNCPYCNEIGDTQPVRTSLKDTATGLDLFLIMCLHCKTDFIVREDGLVKGLPKLKAVGKTEEGKYIFEPDLSDQWTEQQEKD